MMGLLVARSTLPDCGGLAPRPPLVIHLAILISVYRLELHGSQATHCGCPHTPAGGQHRPLAGFLFVDPLRLERDT